MIKSSIGKNWVSLHFSRYMEEQSYLKLIQLVLVGPFQRARGKARSSEWGPDRAGGNRADPIIPACGPCTRAALCFLVPSAMLTRARLSWKPGAEGRGPTWSLCPGLWAAGHMLRPQASDSLW